MKRCGSLTFATAGKVHIWQQRKAVTAEATADLSMLGLCGGKQEKPNTRKSGRRYPEILVPGEKVQVDVKEVPYNCLKGAARRDGKHLYQWTAIDEYTRIRFIYGFEEHTPENSVKFFKMLQKIFPF